MKIILLLFAFTTIYCNNHHSATTRPASNDLKDGEIKSTLSSDTIETISGAEFSIGIRASMGTGNRWMLEDSLDKQYLILIRTVITTDSTEMAAKPDLQTFTFKALNTGSSSISFVYKRPWKKNTEANAERKKYFIKIN
ncbi:MAG: protease inhibitor I42 family protein [Chitinophagaceae bacterium]